MEIAAIGATALLGYAAGQIKRRKFFEQNATLPLNQEIQQYGAFVDPQFQNVVGCSGSYPAYYERGNGPYVPRMDELYQQWKNGGTNVTVGGPPRESNAPVGSEGFGNVDYGGNTASGANSVQAQEYMLDTNQRPIADFTHNNMVPFFGGSVKQNMAGTGVPTGNYIDGTNVNSGFDNTTPYQEKLNSFTGLDDTYMHKREVGPQFSPGEQQSGWVNGSPLFRPDKSRYTNSLHIRNDLSPVEKQMVGPGLATDPSIPAQGGFQQFTRVMPNNVSDYKANQLEGRVIAQKWQSGGAKPTSLPGIGLRGEMHGEGKYGGPGVSKNTPNTFWDQCRRPTMTSKAGFVGDYDYIRPEFQTSFKPKNATRDQTSYGYGELIYQNEQPPNTNQTVQSEAFSGDSNQLCLTAKPGNVGAGIVSGTNVGIVRAETWMSQDNNIRSREDCNAVPIGNPGAPGMGMGNIPENYYVNATDRGSLNPQNVEQANLATRVPLFTNTSYLDRQKTTTKETTESAYAGNAGNPNQGSKFWTFGDNLRTTTKETTESAYVGNAQRGDLGDKFITWGDIPKTTTKETTEKAYSGNPANTNIMATSYNQFTGFRVDTPIKQKEGFANVSTHNTDEGLGRVPFPGKPTEKVGGADTFALRGTTLVTNWVAPAGRRNLLGDPETQLGKVDFGTFGSDQNFNGPGTIRQALPDASKYQYKQYMAEPFPPPNKFMGIDDRQTATYQIDQLKENPLSIFTVKPDNKIPALFCNIEPSNFSPVVTSKTIEQPSTEGNLAGEAVPVYPSSDNKNRVVNPNSQMLFSLSKNSTESVNDLLLHGQRTDNSNPIFAGKCYSGEPNLNEQIKIGGKDAPNVYGSIPNNDALHFAGNMLELS